MAGSMPGSGLHGRRRLLMAACGLCAGVLSAVAVTGAGAVDMDASPDGVVIATPSAPRADLSVSVVDSRDPVLVDGDLTYRVIVANLGPQRATRTKLLASVVGATDVVARLVAGTGPCTVPRAVQVRCPLGAIGSGRKKTILVTVRPTAVGTVSLTAVVSSASLDGRRRNNRVTQTTRVLGLNSVQGRGIRSTAGDAGRPTVTTEIDARSDPTAGGSVSGTFSVLYAATSTSPARGSNLRGRVVCLSVEGNRAMVAGIVESSNSAAYPAGTTVRLAITDNGEPGAGRDTQVGFLGGDGQATCALEPVPELPLIEGNFVVRDGEP